MNGTSPGWRICAVTIQYMFFSAAHILLQCCKLVALLFANTTESMVPHVNNNWILHASQAVSAKRVQHTYTQAAQAHCACGS